MSVSATDLLEAPPSEGSFSPVYLIGPGKAPRAKATTFEPLLAERVLDTLVNAAVDEAERDMALASFHADEADVRSVVNEAQTLPFLTQRRVVVVRNADRYQTAATGTALLDYLVSPNDTTVLILLMNAIDKRTKLYKTIEKNGAIVECRALNPGEVKKWIRAEVKSRGCSIDDAAVDELFSRAGTHLSDVQNALTLVINFLGDESTRISDDAVRKACSDVAEEEIWALTDAIAASRSAEALLALRNLMDLGKHPDEIIGTINWLLKNAYLVANARGDAGISRFVAQKVEPLARKLGPGALRRAFALCTDTQFAMRNTGTDGALAIELLVIKLAAPRKSAA